MEKMNKPLRSLTKTSLERAGVTVWLIPDSQHLKRYIEMLKHAGYVYQHSSVRGGYVPKDSLAMLFYYSTSHTSAWMIARRLPGQAPGIQNVAVDYYVADKSKLIDIVNTLIGQELQNDGKR